MITLAPTPQILNSLIAMLPKPPKRPHPKDPTPMNLKPGALRNPGGAKLQRNSGPELCMVPGPKLQRVFFQLRVRD